MVAVVEAWSPEKFAGAKAKSAVVWFRGASLMRGEAIPPLGASGGGCYGPGHRAWHRRRMRRCVHGIDGGCAGGTQSATRGRGTATVLLRLSSSERRGAARRFQLHWPWRDAHPGRAAWEVEGKDAGVVFSSGSGTPGQRWGKRRSKGVPVGVGWHKEVRASDAVWTPSSHPVAPGRSDADRRGSHV